MNSRQDVVNYLRANDDFIVVGHENPDPDSLGSMLGLYFGLTKLGKTCRMVSGDPVPTYLSWPGLDQIEYISQGFEPGQSCVIVVDCAPDRTGAINEGVLKAKRLVNIDHHVRERGLGNVVYVESAEAATSVIIYRILRELGVAFDLEMATALYGGIVGDTGGFRHANTDGEVLEIAGELLDCGVKPAPIAREIFSSQSFGFLQLLGFALSNLQTAEDGKIAWMTIRYEDFQRFDVDPSQGDSLVNFARMLDSAEIAMIIREIAPGKIRLGLRAYHVDVGRLARHLGGGGHKLASGASLEGNIREMAEKIVRAAKHYLVTGELDEWYH